MKNFFKKIENKIFNSFLFTKKNNDGINQAKMQLFLSIQRTAAKNRIDKFINEEFSELRKIFNTENKIRKKRWKKRKKL